VLIKQLSLESEDEGGLFVNLLPSSIE